MRPGARLRRDPAPAPLPVAMNPAACNKSSSLRMTTGLVLTLPASNADVTASPSLYARTASTCTATANRQLVRMEHNVTDVVTFVKCACLRLLRLGALGSVRNSAQAGRFSPIFFIRESNVVGFTPRSSAAPSAPLIFQLALSRTAA